VLRTRESLLRSLSRRKPLRMLASQISLKSVVNPQACWSLLRFILAFLEQQLAFSAQTALGRRLKGRFQPAPPYRRTALDPRLASKVQFSAAWQESRSFDLQLAPALDECQLLRTERLIEP
jgi:hypothetical protein